MTKIKKTIKIFFIVALSVPLCSMDALSFEDNTPALKISIEQAINAALGSMEDIKVSAVETEVLYHKYRETKTRRYPNLTGYGQWTNNARYPVNQIYPEGRLSDYEAGVGAIVRQTIWSFGRISTAVESAQKSVEVSRLNEQVKQADVVYSTKISYYTVIFAERALEIVLDSHENSLDNKRILEERSAVGRVSRKDNIKVEADIATRVPLVTNVEADIISAKNNLKRAMGIDLAKEIEIAEGFEEKHGKIRYDDMVKYLWKKEPTLRMLEENISLRDSLIKAERAEYFPNISAFASWDYFGRSDSAKDWHIGKERLMDQFGVIGLQLEFPIFDSGKIRERIKQAQKEKEKAELMLQKTSKDLELELNNAISEYNEYLKTLEANKQSVELSEKSFKLFQDLFKTGQVTLLELNDAELTLTNQKLAKEATLYNLNIVMAKIERLISEGEGE